MGRKCMTEQEKWELEQEANELNPDNYSKGGTYVHPSRGNPDDYVANHKARAVSELDRMAQAGVIVHRKWEASDGCYMPTVWAIIEHKGELSKIYWSDSNGGEFFRNSPAGGSSPLRHTMNVQDAVKINK